ESKGLGTQLQYTDVPASQDAITGLALSLDTTGRTLDVVARSTLTTPLDTAQIIIMPGHVKLANVGELIARNMGGLATQFARHVVGEQIPKDAIGQVRPGDLVAKFANVPNGDITACAIGLAGDMMDREAMRKIQKHVAELELRCVFGAADTKVLVIE